MAILTWILLMLFAQQTYCHSTGKHKSPHHKNAKKSFLADAMKEMEYGQNAATATTRKIVQNNTKSAARQKDNQHINKERQEHAKKKVVNQDQFVAKIFPSKLIAEVSKKEQDTVDKSKKHDDETPKLGTIHSKLLSKGDESTKNKGSLKSDSKVLQDAEFHGQNSNIAPSSSLQHMAVSSTITTNITIVSSNSSKSVSEKIDIGKNNKGGKKKGPRKSIKDTIRLLQAFVEKLLKSNETKQSNQSKNSSKPKPTMRQSEKKDVLKEALPIHVHPDDGQQSTVISGVKYNLAPVYRIKTKNSKDAANSSNSSNSSPEQQEKQQEKQQQPKEQPEQKQEQEQQKEQQEPQEKQQQQQQQQEQQQQEQKEEQQKQQQNNTQNNSQGDIEKLKQEEILLRQSLAEKELEIQKLKQQNPPSVNNNTNQVVETTAQTPNITNDSIKHDDSPSLDDQAMKFASLKGVPSELLMKLKTILEEKRKKGQNIVSKQEVHSRKAFETARKLVKAALAREQLFIAEQDFFEKVKEMMNKTSTANLVKENADAQKETIVNNDEGTIKDYIQQIEKQSQLESKVRRTSPSPLQTSILSNTTTQGLNDAVNATAGLQERNSPQGAVSLDLQASAARVLKQLNRTKGPEEKNVEAAAHLEEKVAEQQDEMYDKLIRQTLGKGMGGDEEDDQDDDEEDGATRNMNPENRPEEEMGRQENYGDFQDTDEDAQSRSDISDVKQFNQNETLPAIDEDSLLSL